jgi:phosphosulfolactate synthase
MRPVKQRRLTITLVFSEEVYVLTVLSQSAATLRVMASTSTYTSTLTLPPRAARPRKTGLTMVIDGGLPPRHFEDLVSLGAEYIDYVKFGWGTSVVTNCLRDKIRVLQSRGIGFYFGGTLFEKFVLQGRLDDYRRFCADHECRHVEVSNGTIDMTNTEKAGYIRKLAADFTVVSEVGFKDSGRSQQLPPSAWVECIGQDLDAGASLVTMEARESGKSGICRPDGELRYGLVEDVLSSGVPGEALLWEAPTTALQAYLITRLGPDVNLGNVPANGVIGLETLRLGLRSDTLTAFERPLRLITATNGGREEVGRAHSA